MNPSLTPRTAIDHSGAKRGEPWFHPGANLEGRLRRAQTVVHPEPRSVQLCVRAPTRRVLVRLVTPADREDLIVTSPEAPTDAPAAAPSLAASLSALGVMVAAILLSVALFGGEVDSGPLQVAMTLGLAAAVLIAARSTHDRPREFLGESMVGGITSAIATFFLIIVIGMLVSSLLLAGTIATMLSYGAELATPTILYPVASSAPCHHHPRAAPASTLAAAPALHEHRRARQR